MSKISSFILCVAAFVVSSPALAQDASENYIPDDMTVAIGAGVTFPGDIFVFNRASVKLAFGQSLQLEPFVGLKMESIEDKITGPGVDDEGNPITETRAGLDDTTSFVLGANVMLPLASTNKSQLSLVGSVAVANQKNTDDPDGDDNTTTKSLLSASIGYGVAVEYWFSKNISLSAMASTPLFTTVSSTTTVELPEDAEGTSESSESVISLSWSPTVAATLNLWF